MKTSPAPRSLTARQMALVERLAEEAVRSEGRHVWPQRHWLKQMFLCLAFRVAVEMREQMLADLRASAELIKEVGVERVEAMARKLG